MDRATLEITAAVRPDVFQAITQVNAEWVVRYATLGQNSWTLGMKPAIAGTVHLWNYPLQIPDGGLGNQVNTSGFTYLDAYYKPPSKGWLEIDPTWYSVNVTTGVVTYTGPQQVQLGDRIYATYDVDTDNAAFSLPQLGNVLVFGAAAELGGAIYSQATQEWALVTQYRDRYAALCKQLLDGTLIPDEVRRLNFWVEIERVSPEVKSFRLNRA